MADIVDRRNVGLAAPRPALFCTRIGDRRNERNWRDAETPANRKTIAEEYDGNWLSRETTRVDSDARDTSSVMPAGTVQTVK